MKKSGEYTEVGRKDPEDKSDSGKISSMSNILSVFLRVQDELNGEEIDLDLLDNLLTAKDIDTEIDSIPVGFMLMSSLAAYAEERRDNHKDKIDELYGLLDDEVRENMAVRPTDAKAKAAVKSHPKYLKMCKRLNKYSRQFAIFKAAAKAYELKKDMIQTKSANNRKLIGNDELQNPGRAYDKIMNKKKKLKKG